jgi:hypothetical protein
MPGIEAAGGRCGGARSVGSSAVPEEEVEMAWRSWRHVDAAGEGTDGLLARSMDMMGEGGDGTLLVSRHLASSSPSSTPLWLPTPKDRGLGLLPAMA